MARQTDALTERIIGAAIEVHRALGPGMLESAYESCLAMALAESALKVERQKLMPLQFRGAAVNLGYRLDLLVEDLVVVEIKAVQQQLERVHMAQLLSYLPFWLSGRSAFQLQRKSPDERWTQARG